MELSRQHAERLDAADPLAGLRNEFVHDDDELIYLDGNSLGRLPHATRRRLAHVVEDEWGRGLVGSWSHWIEQPGRVGDLLGAELLGAAAGQVVVSDTTTVNLYKLAMVALDARPGRSAIVTDDDNFPTDRYVLEGIAAQRGLVLRMIHSDIDKGASLDALRSAVDDDTALVCLSHVAYRSGALLDMAEVNELVHARGALALWDVCHAVGAVPIELDATGTDLAVGCTYKYVNAGPGAPAFLYVRRELHAGPRQPIWGWFGQRDQFEMGPSYDPEPTIARFTTASPAIVGIAAVEEGVRLLVAAGIDRLRAKGVALTSYLIELADAWLPGFTLATPRDPARRGSHVTLHHPEAWRITQALIDAKVIADYRSPDRLRLGPVSAYTRFAEVWDGMARLREIAETHSYRRYPDARSRVT